MSGFHPTTIRLLQAALHKYADELEDARNALATAQLLVDEKAAIVADCERFLDFAELVDADQNLAVSFAEAQADRNLAAVLTEPAAPSPLSSTPLAVAFGAAPVADGVYVERVDDEHFVEYAGEGTGFTATLKRLDGNEVTPVSDDEYFDAAEADDVREIRREMAIEAGDDSEADRQAAEDDARNEPAAEARRAVAAPRPGQVCSVCGDRFAAEEHAVPAGVAFVGGGQLFAHADCRNDEPTMAEAILAEQARRAEDVKGYLR